MGLGQESSPPAPTTPPANDRGGVPPACHQAGEQAVLGRVIVEVKGLRIELACKRLDLCRVHDVCFAGEALPHLEVIEIKRIVATYLT